MAALVIYLLISVLGGGGGGSLDDLVGVPINQGVPQAEGEPLDCQIQHANVSEDCQVVGFVNSLQSYSARRVRAPRQVYRCAPTTLFEGQVSTGCGVASSQVGPFYCPPDGSVYIDLGFFDDLAARRRGRPVRAGLRARARTATTSRT